MTGLRRFKEFDHQRHNPAVGRFYGKEPLRRLLIVGMSHHGDSSYVRRPRFTHQLVKEVIEGKRRIPYFTKIAGTFRDSEGRRYRPREFYSEVAFYNFLPDVFKVRERVLTEQWLNRDTQGYFWKVVDYLKPDRILVTGEQLWCALPSRDQDRGEESRDVTGDAIVPNVPFACEEPECCWYRVGDSDRCLVGAISHPSSSKFNKERTRINEWIEIFMNMKWKQSHDGAKSDSFTPDAWCATLNA